MTTMVATTAATVTAITIAGCAIDADARATRETAPADGDTPSAVMLSGTMEATAPANAVRFVVAPTGNAARYRVRERLMGRDLDNDAVGETSQVSGAIVVDATGALVPAQSRVVVGTSAFRSDSDRRDGYVRGRLLQAEKFPTVELAPTALRGLPATLPPAGAAAGPIALQLVGDLTVRGVTRPTTWRVTARQSGGQVVGTATTKFTFADFAIDPPRVPVVLSVADTIALEYDFTLTRQASPGQ